MLCRAPFSTLLTTYHRGGFLMPRSETQDPTIQARPVRFVFTPTGLISGFGLPFDSVAHQIVIVGDPIGQDEVLLSQLLRVGNGVEEMTTRVVLAPALAELYNKAQVVGYTLWTDMEIKEAGKLDL
jgi:hypothetical protein